MTGQGAPLPSRLPGQGPRPGRSAGPGRLSSFLGCDPGVRLAPPPTTMEAEAAAETATAAVAPHRIRSRSQTALIWTGLPQWLFASSTPRRHYGSGSWFGIGGFRPSGRKLAPVSGRSVLVVTPKPPPGLLPPRPAPPRSSPAFSAAPLAVASLAPAPRVTPCFPGPRS